MKKSLLVLIGLVVVNLNAAQLFVQDVDLVTNILTSAVATHTQYSAKGLNSIGDGYGGLFYRILDIGALTPNGSNIFRFNSPNTNYLAVRMTTSTNTSSGGFITGSLTPFTVPRSDLTGTNLVNSLLNFTNGYAQLKTNLFITNLIQGGSLYAGVGGLIAQDTNFYFYNETNHSLSVGLNNVIDLGTPLTVSKEQDNAWIETLRYNSSAPRFAFGNGGTDGFSAMMHMYNSSASSLTNTPRIKFNTYGNSYIAPSPNGNFGLGTTTPTEMLDVVGNLKVSGNGTISNLTMTGILNRPVSIMLLNNAQNALYAIEGKEINIFYKDVIYSYQSSKEYSIVITCSKGTPLKTRWTYLPTSADAGTVTFTLSVWSADLNTLLASKTVNLITSALVYPPSPVSRSLVVIGDSTGVGPLGQLTNLFIGDTHYGLTLKGSNKGPRIDKGGISRQIACEAISGWSYQLFDTSTNLAWTQEDGTSRLGSPFVVAGHTQFDFGSYMTNWGITLVSNDWVWVNLGINDFGSQLTQASCISKCNLVANILDRWVANIKAAVPGIRLSVTLPISPSRSQDAFGTSYNDFLDRRRYRRNIQIWNQLLLDFYDNNHLGTFYIIPLNSTMDTKHNMSTSPRSFNDENPYFYDSQSNGVHPADIGYWEIANMYMGFLKGRG